jgi:hypothetical protein
MLEMLMPLLERLIPAAAAVVEQAHQELVVALQNARAKQAVLASSLFVMRVHNVAQVELLHFPVDTPSIHSHHLEHTQDDRRTQTPSCYVSERRIDAL